MVTYAFNPSRSRILAYLSWRPSWSREGLPGIVYWFHFLSLLTYVSVVLFLYVLICNPYSLVRC